VVHPFASSSGVDASIRKPVPKRIESDSWPLLPPGSGRNPCIRSLMQVTLAPEEAFADVVVVLIGVRATKVNGAWV